MNPNFLDFEQPIAELDAKIEELRHASSGQAFNIDEEVGRLREKLKLKTNEIFRNLNSWQTTQLSRHPARPYTLDYIGVICEEFHELAGDRMYADDAAIVGGLGRINGRSVVIIGHQKGRDTKTKVRRNFGMPRPEGYRKALRLMKMAERFGLPLLTLIDTPGAYPGVGAEERGQAEAIARSTSACLGLKVPSISVVIGEGGSGGAIAIATANRVYMLEHAIYSVISPEGAASILWRDTTRLKDAATNMKITAQDLLQMKVIDAIIPEPMGGAQRAPETVIAATGDLIAKTMKEFAGANTDFREQRREKYL
ncbi:MAG TPA: acetyl-CoA carboxylase carboxyltransferase subunit alpha, partial [Rhodanobacter sp.]|nr:acetyl-CoA carboxylase carboxyltransferase subunit alpha [Rhodanobacter sp.]